ncbi:MAG TPA: M18 family aminopeptidase [Spirochaetia bacterium]|nr:M18 family aminopeptidase [Spirochaetia bacterium]
MHVDSRGESVSGLRAFIESSPTPYHAALSISERLEGDGFLRLAEADAFSLTPAGKYFVRRGGAVVAFRIGEQPASSIGFRVAAAHTDSPTLKLKVGAERRRHGVVSVPVEVYGGAIVSSWIDRDLGVAGVLATRENGGSGIRFYRSSRPVAVIPNLAIHLNRSVNEGFEYNKQDHLPAILQMDDVDSPEQSGNSRLDPGTRISESILVRYAASQLGIDPGAVVDADLYLWDMQPPALVGVDESLICSGRLDNLAACYSAVEAIQSAQSSRTSAVAAFFNNEEIGSRTREGADSGMLRTILERIVLALGGDREEFHRALASSFLISNDAAHAVHPNFADKHDPAYSPRLNRGPVIKYNGNFRYTTTAQTAAYFEDLCRRCDVPVQRFVNRSDMASGSTIGPAASALSEVPAVDVGIPILGMHSIRETAGVNDPAVMTRVLAQYFAESAIF